jgi:integrase
VKGHVRYRSGAWRLTVEGGNDPLTGKRRQIHRTVRAPDTKAGRRTAESALAKLLVDVDDERVVPGSGLTVSEVLERYVELREDRWSPGAGDETRRRIELHIAPAIGKVAIDRLRPVDIERFYAKLRKNGMGASTIARLHDILRAALRQAVRWDLIPSSPADRVDPPRRTRTEVAPPAAADVTRLLDVEDPTLALYLRISAVTGARRGQVCALRWSAIDVDAGEIRFTRALAKVPGGVVEKGTKTGARYPVAIDPTTVQLLRDHRRRQAEASLAVGARAGKNAYLFATDPAGTQPWHPDGASQRFATVRKALGLEHVRLHDLRHWMATQLLAEGFDVVTLAGRGGWSNTATPLEVYAHFQPARDRAAADRLAQVLDRPASS